MKEVVGNQGFSWNVLFPNEGKCARIVLKYLKTFTRSIASSKKS